MTPPRANRAHVATTKRGSGVRAIRGIRLNGGFAGFRRGFAAGRARASPVKITQRRNNFTSSFREKRDSS